MHRTDRGELYLFLPAPTVFVFDYAGFTDASFIPFIAETWQRELGRAGKGTVQVYADTSGQTGFTSGFRTGLMEWSRGTIDRTNEYVLLVKSRWVAMGIAIVRATIGLPLPHAEVMNKRELFESRLEAAVGRSLAGAGSVARR